MFLGTNPVLVCAQGLLVSGWARMSPGLRNLPLCDVQFRTVAFACRCMGGCPLDLTPTAVVVSCDAGSWGLNTVLWRC